MFKLILCFSEIPKTFICISERQGAFLSKPVSALEIREKEAYRKQTGSNVSVLLNKFSALQHDRFSRFHFRLSHDYLQILKLKL